MKIARGVLAAPVGFVIAVGIIRALAGVVGPVENYATSMNYYLASLTSTILAALIGGYIAALIAGAHEFPHAAALGLLMIGASVFAMRQEGAVRPGWSEISVAGCGPIAAMIGAALRLLTKRNPAR